jgi:hypothetical protein
MYRLYPRRKIDVKDLWEMFKKLRYIPPKNILDVKFGAQSMWVKEEGKTNKEHSMFITNKYVDFSDERNVWQRRVDIHFG